MQVATYLAPDAFLSIVQEGLERHEAENSLMLGGLIRMRGADSDARHPPLLLLVENDGSWCLAGMMTPPHPLVLAASSRDVPRNAIALLIQFLVNSRLSVPGVVAIPALARAFAERWTAMCGTSVGRTVRQRIYALVTTNDVPTEPGYLRRATPHDAELVGRWFAEFASEALNDDSEHIVFT